VVIRRGGPGHDFYAPGDDHGGPWGAGENWPLDPQEGGPLPQDPKIQSMWKTFWGDDFSKISPSNRKNAVPGAWRIEVSPSLPAEEDFFLHVFEIGNMGTTGNQRTELFNGVNFLGAASETGAFVLIQYIGFCCAGRGSVLAGFGLRFAHRVRPAAGRGLRA
jgi:hypothetical protein